MGNGREEIILFGGLFLGTLVKIQGIAVRAREQVVSRKYEQMLKERTACAKQL